ncbi:MAG: DUF3365 domain-containing protein [Pseudomonadota bacterium]
MLASSGPAFARAKDLHIAISLAELLRASRTVISRSQAVINDPSVGDKGLTGDVVLQKAIDGYKTAIGVDPRSVDPGSRLGRLLKAQMAAIVHVVDRNQQVINKKGVGFKGFVPAVFARLVNERFKAKVGRFAEIKVTAPPALVRNRTARPDPWETRIITTRLMQPKWPVGRVYAAVAESRGRKAYRVLVPEYYGKACLACHGAPKGSKDVTGYPKEGRRLGELGGIISITLYDPQ